MPVHVSVATYLNIHEVYGHFITIQKGFSIILGLLRIAVDASSNRLYFFFTVIEVDDVPVTSYLKNIFVAAIANEIDQFCL